MSPGAVIWLSCGAGLGRTIGRGGPLDTGEGSLGAVVGVGVGVSVGTVVAAVAAAAGVRHLGSWVC